MNKIILTGNLGKDFELKATTGGSMIGTGQLAVKRMFVKEGYQDTDWWNLKAFGKQAETMAQYLKKGSTILVEGSAQIDTWKGDDGNWNKYEYIKIDRFEFLDKKGSNDSGYSQEFEDIDSDDSIPF